MARNGGVRIEMFAREVVAFREPFLARGEPLHDPDVALDEISAFRAAQEPVVLRVRASGGAERERARVARDWLCEPGEEPREISDLLRHWGRSPESEEWSRGRRWIDAWELCENADWLVYAAGSVGADRSLVIGAAARCLRLSASGPGGIDDTAWRSALAASEAVARLWPSDPAQMYTPIGDARHASRVAAYVAGLRPDLPAYAAASSLAEAAYSVAESSASRFATLAAEAVSLAGAEWVGGTAPGAVRGAVPTIEVLRAARSRP